MGGDGGLAVTAAACQAMKSWVDITLVGEEVAIRAALSREAESDEPEGVSIQPAGDRVASSDALSDVLRRRPDTSMRRALELHAEGRVDAVVSAGDTAALMALSKMLLSMVPGIERPAICKSIQGIHGPFWMLDLGANLDCPAHQLTQFAGMGVTLARHLGRIESPRVALLNIGTEETKGPSVIREAATILEGSPHFVYVGYIEGNALFDGMADVVVCDGFAGNIAVKSIEGAARMAGHMMRRWLESLSPLQKAGLSLSRSRLESLRQDLNPQKYNGASFVGLDGIVVKSHGAADAQGFACAIEQAVAEVDARIPQRLAEQFSA
jgi:glycerol-3-phosphate acyltransferase PlsX